MTSPPSPPRATSALRGRLDTLGELAAVLIEHGRWWLVPMVGVLLLASAALVVLHAAQYVAPFVYSIF